jgi:cobalt-zinc-cadmium efflux system membrane fusion protein
MIRRTLLPLIALLVLTLPGRTPGEEEHHEEHGTVVLSQAECDEFGIVIEKARPGSIEATLDLPGEVQPNAERLAHIVPRFSGIVTEVRARIGDRVEKGQILAVIEGDASLSAFEVTTFISGTIIDTHITLGESASRDRVAFVVADLSTVWIDFTVYQRDLGRIHLGQPAQVFIGHDSAEDAGTIQYITPIVDEHTRTATARLVLPNEKRVWRPGMFVTTRVTVESAEVPVAIPGTAVQAVEGETVVFVKTGEGFVPRTVVLGRRSPTHFEVLAGLAPGDEYVSQGGFTLKAELEKEAFGDGHGH